MIWALLTVPFFSFSVLFKMFIYSIYFIHFQISDSMKKLLFCIVFTHFLSVPTLFFAQNTEGVISYVEVINLHRRMKERGVESRVLAMVPETQTNKMELYFKNDESLYKAEIDDSDDMPPAGGGGMSARMMRPNTELHTNAATELMTEFIEMMGKKYLIIDTARVLPWKLTTEKKKIAGYNCIKATLDDSVRTGRGDSMRLRSMIAWFAEEIPLPIGPSQYASLPGAILEIDINDGDVKYTASKIEFKKVSDSDIKCPNKGEKITRPEFAKKMMEMRRERGGMRRE